MRILLGAALLVISLWATTLKNAMNADTIANHLYIERADSTDDDKLRNELVSRKFKFTIPFNTKTAYGSPTSYSFDVTVDGGVVNIELPSIYRGEQITTNPYQEATNGKYKSKKFYYKVMQRNNGSGYTVIIEPIDFKQIKQLFFDINENRRASLTVTTGSQYQIVYNGIISSAEPEL